MMWRHGLLTTGPQDSGCPASALQAPPTPSPQWPLAVGMAWPLALRCFVSKYNPFVMFIKSARVSLRVLNACSPRLSHGCTQGPSAPLRHVSRPFRAPEAKRKRSSGGLKGSFYSSALGGSWVFKARG